jgi:ABC-2 type transport system ATP-binding protein/lipopolysaccharide transport system ATP-binding protein
LSPAIKIVNVSKAFTIRHNKADSLKSKVIGTFYKRYREQRENLWALKNVTFEIGTGETFGLIGRNGSGKSTLLKIIAGIYSPSAGEVRLAANASIGTMIELGVGFHWELTGKENIFLGGSIYGLTRKEIEEKYQDIVDFSELSLFMDTPMKNYSSGMQARLGFALAANLDPEILLLDEVLAVGDEGFQQKCMNRIEEFRARNKTIVFVSHNADAVRQICNRACLLDNGAVLYIGKSEDALERYHALLNGATPHAIGNGAVALMSGTGASE